MLWPTVKAAWHWEFSTSRSKAWPEWPSMGRTFTTSFRQRQLEAIRKVSANICKTNKKEKKRKRKEGLWDFFWCGGVIGANRYQGGSIHTLNFNFFIFCNKSTKFFWCGCNWIERTGTKTAQKFQINQITLNSKILACTYKYPLLAYNLANRGGQTKT